MPPFLLRLAETLLKRHGGRLDKVAVVLPGKRAGLHLRKYLAQAHGGPLWSPDILDVGSFLERVSGIQQGNSMELLLHLFDLHRLQATGGPDTLAEFLEWGPTTMRDMSEVDAHLLDLNGLYKDLRAYHELEEWSFRLGELSPAQQRSNAQWRATGDLHRAFQERMLQHRTGTSGFVARRCAEITIEKIPLPWHHIWFAGLNALDPATTATIQHLQEQGRADVAWDSDRFYLEDERQEAGRYLRRSMKTLGEGALPPQNDILGQQRRLTLVEAPHPIAQVAYVAQHLNDLSAEQRSRTAVVLAQEDLLLPLLERIPANIGPVNVTMGMPLSALPVHALTEAYLELASSRSTAGLEISRLIALLGHPFLREGVRTEKTLADLRARVKPWIEQAELFALLRSTAPSDMDAWERALGGVGDVRRLREGFVGLFNKALGSTAHDPVVREQLSAMADVQERLDRLLERMGLVCASVSDYRAIRDRLLREERMAFLGEPMRGLQVMGLLETRAVDHERLIIVGLNEGVLPRTDPQVSWIPFDLRKHHGLPIPADAEAVTAYNFQRAMQLTSEVVWTTSTGVGKDPGEPSRFVAQWQHEVIGRSRTVLSVVRTGAPSVVRGVHPVHVAKDGEVQERLKALCARGLSPSALGTWMRCPMDFYFRYIAGIREQEVEDGRLGSDVLGDAVHKVLERILSPLVGKRIPAEHLTAAADQVPLLLTDELARELPHDVLDLGHYRLRREMASKAVQSYLRAEAKRVADEEDRSLAIEEEVQCTLTSGVKLRGRVDRVDLRKRVVTIIDVKTGAVRSEDLRITTLSRESLVPAKRYALQLIIYAHAYLHQHPDVGAVRACIIPLQRHAHAQGEYLSIAGETTIDRSMLPAIDVMLSTLIDELLDQDVPFQHDPGSSYCACCVA